MFASLRSRILLILIAAVVPAAFLVCVFAYRTFDDARTMQIASLERDAEFLLSRLDVVPASAMRMAATLASVRAFSPQVGDCEGRVREVIDRYVAFSAVATLGPDGKTLCAYTKPNAVPVSEAVAAAPTRPGRPSAPGTLIAALPNGSFEILAFAPVTGAGGETVVLAIDSGYVSRLISEFHSTPSSLAEVVDGAGRIVIAPSVGAADSWPATPLPLTEHRATRTAPSAAGQTMVYTVGKLGSGDLWLITGQKESDVLGLPRRQLLVTALAPLVMILVAVVAIWMGLRGSVLRWVSALGKATRAYSAGAMTSRVGDTSEAPVEFAQLASSFDSLADRIAERTPRS